MLGFNLVNTREAFQTPLGEREILRIVVTEHGKRVFKQGALGGVLFGVGLSLVLNRFGSKNNTELRSQAAGIVDKAADAIDPQGASR